MTSEAPRRTRAAAVLRIAVISLAGSLVFMALAWAALPPLLRHLSASQLTQRLGRTVTVDAVSVVPWRLALTVEGLALARAVGDATPGPQARIGRVHVNVTLESLWRLAPVVEALRIEQPEVHVTRLAPQRYDIDDILQRLAPAPGAQPADDAAAPRLALYNLELVQGLATLDDRPAGQVHRVEALGLSLPFLSTLPAHVTVKAQPRLTFRLHGTLFDTGASTTPFAPDRASEVHLKTGEVDLAPWLPYLPAGLPLRPTAGRLAADVVLQFAQPATRAGAPQVRLRGELRAADVSLADPAGDTALAWRSLRVGLDDLEPLRWRVALGTVRFEGLRAQAGRAAGGALRWPGAPAAASVRAAPDSAAESAAVAPTPWQVSLARFELADGSLDWVDEATQPRAALSLTALQVRLESLRWPWVPDGPAARAEVSAVLHGAGQPAGALRVRGTLGGSAAGSNPPPGGAAGGAASAAPPAATFAAPAASVDVTLDGVALAAAHPYLQALLVPRLEGRLAAEARIAWPTLGRPADARIDVHSARLDSLRLVEGAVAGGSRAASGRPAPGMPAIERLDVAGMGVDLAARRVTVQRVGVTRASVGLSRTADGALNAAGWARAAPAVSPAGGTDAGPPWQVTLDAVQVDGARLAWRDAAVAGAVPGALDLEVLNLGLRQLQWPARGSAALTLAARVSVPALPAPGADTSPASDARGAPADPAGTLRWSGQLALQPLSLKGRLNAERLPLHAAQPYLDGRAPVDLLRALGSYQGDLSLRLGAAGPEAVLRGDARLADVRVHARAPSDGGASGRGGGGGVGDELLSWQALEIPALQVRLSPGAPLVVETGELTVSDLYARLVVTEQGRFNLADVAGDPVTAPAAPDGLPPVAPPSAPPPPPASPPLEAQEARGPPLVLLPPASAPAQALPAPQAGADSRPADRPGIAVAGVQIRNARIDFTDRFIRPNYSAALTELNGRLGAFRSGSAQMAALELRGRAAGTALLEIRGSLNPTADPLALDIQARASDLELAPLSPYAGKYAGYAIERGKLTMALNYNIQPDGTLKASNQVILNQLTFGERIESKDATSLPVRLAVALLTDRHGVIDINLPIGGSINDPQFSLGGLIVKVIVNLLVKAVTAPFALLSGGSDELSVVEFVPGTATLAPAAAGVLEKVGQALADRPALQMTVAGAADPASERQAMQRAALEARLSAQARREALRAGRAEAAPTAASAAMAVVPAGPERERLLRQVYRDTSLPDKPRNLIGLAKDLPAADMEALLMAGTVVSTDTARELALQRGLAVRDALIARGLPSERLFLAAPKLRASGEEDAGWTPRVQLTLADR